VSTHVRVGERQLESMCVNEREREVGFHLVVVLTIFVPQIAPDCFPEHQENFQDFQFVDPHRS
jgi:hypothetical protein